MASKLLGRQNFSWNESHSWVKTQEILAEQDERANRPQLHNPVEARVMLRQVAFVYYMDRNAHKHSK